MRSTEPAQDARRSLRDRWRHRLRILPLWAAISILGIYLGSLAPSAQVSPTDTEQPSPESTPTVVALDPATLNLHRWGAVTIFHGLPSDRVNAIAEDADGLLWFGTDNGLVSYDGRNVEPKSIEDLVDSRRVTSLQLDPRDGTLWIGTDAGAARLHQGVMEEVPRTRGRMITGIAISPQHEVALTTAKGEILLYREQTADRSYLERAPAGSLSATRIDQTSQPLLKSPEQPDQTLPLTAVAWTTPGSEPGGSNSGSGEWVIGSSGRGPLIQKAGELREASTRQPRPYFITSAYHDADDHRVWLGERTGKQSGGLWLLSRDTLKKIPLNTGEVTALHGGGGQVWAGTTRQGAYLIKSELGPEGGEAKPIEHLTVENTAGGLRSDHINTVFRDREGLIWFGTDRGVCRYDRESFRTSNVSNNSQSNFVRVLLRTSSGAILGGTNHGLFQLRADPRETDSGPWTEVSELQGRAVYALYEDGGGTVWVGSSSGLFIKPKEASSFKRVTTEPEVLEAAPSADAPAPPAPPALFEAQTPAPEPPVPAALPTPEPRNPQLRESVRAIAGFRRQIYTAIYERGIEKIEIDEHGPHRTLVLSNRAAQHAICLAADGDSALWFGTSDGELWRYDGSQAQSFAWSKDQSGKQPENKTARALRALSISHLRDREQFWLGTSQGLYLREGEVLREVLPEVDVRSLLVNSDAAGREIVWCATQNAGLIKLLPAEDLSIRFDTEEGLASQQVFALIADQSEIWIGTNRGVVRHQPTAARPRLQINRLVADRIYLPKDLTGELALPHTRRNFLLEVTGIGGRTFPSQFQYEFTLQTESGQTLKPPVRTPAPQFAVEELESGGYLILVRAISRDLVYSAPLTVKLRISSAPFPWSILLLTSLLGLAVGAAVWAYRQQRRLARTNRTLEETNSELHETRLRLASETEAERSRVARDLHDQTLADLRHLLVLTDQMPAPPIDEAGPSPARLRREIEAISNEIRHICEDLSPSALENIGFLPAFEWALHDAVAHLPAAGKFAYHVNCEPELEDRLQLSPIEEIQLYRIAQEALNNICRHARARQVRMSIRTEQQSHLVIEIEDDGVGFDGNTTNKTGHGIANIRSRANLIGASVTWSHAAPGCRFKVLKQHVVKPA
ncbi:MAG TPA: two-component regulator propeller domain-containing protein [Blastocatellia bacterium]|nr:two-component regulator propeller domain-containing protein [Blastocatellia bacterium]